MATESLSGSCFPTGGVKPLKEKEIDGVVVCILLSVIVGVLGRKYSKREIFGEKSGTPGTFPVLRVMYNFLGLRHLRSRPTVP